MCLQYLYVGRFQVRITMVSLPTMRADSSGLQAGDQGRYGKRWKENSCVCVCMYES